MASYNRTKRIAEEIKKVISTMLISGIKDPRITSMVSVTDVEVTNDLSFAKIYYTVLDETKKESTQKALEKASSFIRTKLAEKIEIRHTPELKFIYDKSIAYGEHIEELIKEINEKE